MTANDQPRDPREEVRAEIREFLSTRRARITPEQAGLPTYGHERRRVTGLRREEVALLAGVSPQYYVRLERGDATGISESIIDGVAHALQLDDAERAHLVHLLHNAGTPPHAPDAATPAAAKRVRPTIQRLVDSMHATPAVVLNGRLEIVAANAAGTRAVLTRLRRPRRHPQQRPVRLPRPAGHDVLPRMGHRRQRHRRHPARRSRPRPPRPRPLRPRRTALHPQRRLPAPLGRPQRPHPLHRRQALPPPRRRRPRPALRIPTPGTRIEHRPGRLHPRTRLRRPRRTRPARQLGRQRSGRGSARSSPATHRAPRA